MRQSHQTPIVAALIPSDTWFLPEQALMRAWTRCLTVACAMWMMAGPALGSQGTVIRLKNEASVETAVVVLSDVADVVCLSPELRQKLQSVTLAPAPAAGRSLRIDYETIRSRLQSHGVNLAEVNFSGRSAVEVRSAQPVVAAIGEARRDAGLQTVGYETETEPTPDEQLRQAENRVRTALQRHLQRTVPDLGGATVSVQLLREAIPMLLTTSDDKYEVSGGRAPWNLPQVMTIRIRDSYGDQVEIPVLCRIEPQPKALVLRYDIPKGHILRPEDLAWQQVEAGGLYFTNVADLVGREAKRPLRQGQFVEQNDIQNVALVRTNEICTVYSGKPGMVIRRQYKARANGALGDVVPMVSLDSQVQILARVTGLHEAAVIGSEDVSNAPADGPLAVHSDVVGVTYQEQPAELDVPAGGPPPQRFQRGSRTLPRSANAPTFPPTRGGKP